MKLNPLFLSGLVALGGAVSAQAQAVYSINTVGYVNLDIPAGFSMISNPLDAGDNTIGNVLTGSIPNGTTVYKFDAGAGSYTEINTYFNGSWLPSAATTLAPGEGVFINAPSAFSITFSGEVLQGELSNPLPAGYSIVSSQVPQEGTLQSLGYTGNNGDTVYQFNGTSYVINTYFNGSFLPSEPNIGIGEAFFVNRVSAGSWDRNFSTDQ
jgi:hypothetical protein